MASVSAPCMPTLISVPGGKGHREDHDLPGTPCEPVAGQGGVHSRQGLLSLYLHSNHVMDSILLIYRKLRPEV